MGGYIFSIPKCYTRWDLSFCPAINKRKTGPLTDDEVAALGLKFTCAGCGRAEASVVTKHGHERHCAYLRLAQFWDNPHATQEDDCKCCTGPCTCFPVEAVIDMRGPPEWRFVQLVWGPPEHDEDTSEWEFTDTVDEYGWAKPGDGQWRHGWQPIANCANLMTTMIQGWYENNRNIDPRQSIERVGEQRCPYCNWITTEEKLNTHRCPLKPTPRPRDSVAGRMVEQQRIAGLHAGYPTVTLTDPDTGEVHTLDNAVESKSLGHVLSGDSASDKDMRLRMIKADTEFYRGLHLWRSPVIPRKHKLRMFRRYLQIFIYAGAVCWVLNEAALRAINNWTGAKMAEVTGNSKPDENRKRRVKTGELLRFFRRRLLGDVLRSFQDDMRRGEVIMHAEIVRKGHIPRDGSFVMDAPPYRNIDDLKRQAGCPLTGPIEQVGIAAAAEREKQYMSWVDEDKELKLAAADGEDSEEEEADDDDDSNTPEPEGDAGPKLTEEEQTARKAQLKAETAENVALAKQRAYSAGARYVWVVYHDGGSTDAKDSRTHEDVAGWGYWARLYKRREEDGEEEMIEDYKAWGPVQLDAEEPTFVGCVRKSNNTAELSAVPHAMAAAMVWRRQNAGCRGYRIKTRETTGMVMVYDSQYTRDRCTERTSKHGAKNATVISVCRRLVQAAAERQFHVEWVKVKGHSGDEGNDKADAAANWAQNGGAKGEQDIALLMQLLQTLG
jgi:ribonuclease HI